MEETAPSFRGGSSAAEGDPALVSDDCKEGLWRARGAAGVGEGLQRAEWEPNQRLVVTPSKAAQVYRET